MYIINQLFGNTCEGMERYRNISKLIDDQGLVTINGTKCSKLDILDKISFLLPYVRDTNDNNILNNLVTKLRKSMDTRDNSHFTQEDFQYIDNIMNGSLR